VKSGSKNDSGYDYSSELFAVSDKTCVATSVSTFGKTDYANIVTSIIDIYEAIEDTVSANTNPRAAFAGCVLRMAGHDFMDYRTDTGLGGSDGCINFNDEDNTGIPSCVAAHGLVAAYAEFCESVSLADWMVIAGEAIMGRTATDFSNTATDVYYADGQLAGDF
jgi:catalase (peroxidase I)